MSSTSPPAACQEKTWSPGVQCHNLPLGTLAPACLSRLVMMLTWFKLLKALIALRHTDSGLTGGKVKDTYKLPF